MEEQGQTLHACAVEYKSAHWLYSGKNQVLLVCRTELLEIGRDFANWMITIFLSGCPFNLGIKIIVIDFFVIEGYIYKAACTLFYLLTWGQKQGAPSQVAEQKTSVEFACLLHRTLCLEVFN